jgi:ferredoxin
MGLAIRVNPITCTGHGVCAELLPEIIELDPWGYPLLGVAATDIPKHLREHARRAVAGCPVLALLLRETHVTRRGAGYG